MIWQTRVFIPLMRLVLRGVQKNISKLSLSLISSGLNFEVDTEAASLALFPQQWPLTKETQFLTGGSSSYSLDIFSYSFDPSALYPGSIATVLGTRGGKSETTTETTARILVSRDLSMESFQSFSNDLGSPHSSSDLPLTLVFAAEFAPTTNETLINVDANFSSENNPKEGPEAWRKISLPSSKTADTISKGGWQIQGKRHRNVKDRSSNLIFVNGNLVNNPFLVFMGPEEDLDTLPQEPETSYPLIKEVEVHEAVPKIKTSSLPENVLSQILTNVLASSSFPMIKMRDTSQSSSLAISSDSGIPKVVEPEFDWCQSMPPKPLAQTFTRNHANSSTKPKMGCCRGIADPYRYAMAPARTGSPVKFKKRSQNEKPIPDHGLKHCSIEELVTNLARICVEMKTVTKGTTSKESINARRINSSA